MLGKSDKDFKTARTSFDCLWIGKNIRGLQMIEGLRALADGWGTRLAGFEIDLCSSKD